MKHIHNYETVSHHGVTAELVDLGIVDAEMRRCTKCLREMPFVRTSKGEWVQLFEEEESAERDILLA